jgi:hypothetical protein
MNAFQIVVLSLLAVVLVASLVASMRGWFTRREVFAWSAVCLAAGVATWSPELTRKVANALGIGRGADLVFYCAVGVMLIGFWMVYIRLRHLRRQMTLLVRQLAILEGQRQYPPGSDDVSP